MLFFDPKAIDRTGDDSPASSLYGFLWRMSGAHQFVIVAAALLVAALNVVPLELQRRIVDDAIKNDDTQLLYLLVGIYLATITVQALAKLFMRLYQGWLSESAILYCRRHLAGLYAEANGNGTGLAKAHPPEEGTAIAVVRAEIEQVGGFVGEGLSEPATQGGILIAVLGYMLWVEPFIVLCSLGFLVPQLIVIPMIQKYLNRLVEQRITLLREMSDIMTGELNAEELTTDEPERSRDGFIIASFRVFRKQMAFYFWKFSGKALVNYLNAAAPLTALGIGGYMVIQGQTKLGIVVAFTSGFAKLAEPIRELITFYRDAGQTAVKHRMIASWMQDVTEGKSS